MLGVMALGGEAQIEAWEAQGLKVTEEMILSASDTFQQAFQSSVNSGSGPSSISINRYAIMMQQTDVPEWFIQEYKESLSHLDSATRKTFESGALYATAHIKLNAAPMIGVYKAISDYQNVQK
jgi:hypothetical protein